MEKPRLRHVAELAGVSQATVSRVVNGRPGVAEDTRRTVLRALQELGYEPVGLQRAARTGLVGLILPELDNPVFPAFAQAIENRLARHGYTAILCTSTPAGMHERDYLDVLIDHAVSGVVFISGAHSDTHASHARYHDLHARGLPVVLVNGRPDDLAELPAVSADDRAGTRTAVRHLVELGHRRIGYLAGPGRYVPTQRKVEGYLDGLAEAGIPDADAVISETVYSVEGGHAGALELLAAGVSAIVCGSDVMALGTLRAARERGLDVPRDLSVVGFDDAGIGPFLTPPLTSLRQPIDAMANAVVVKLREQIEGRPVNLTEFLFRTDLVVRGSTGRARVAALGR